MSLKEIPGSPFTAFAFEVLYCKLNKLKDHFSLKDYTKLYGPENFPLKETKYPLFVTWNTLRPFNHRSIRGERTLELRGCIGNFSGLDLQEGIAEYSLIAAFEDPRFDPIEKDELNSLACDVTLLKHFEPISDILNWEIGVHGLRMNFIWKGRRRSSTFLPSVAKEFGWSKEETLKHLISKGGGPDHVDNLSPFKIELVRYQGEKSNLTYDEFIWVRKQLAN